MERTPWINKEFDFSFPATNCPYILERLRGTILRVEAKIKDIPEAILSEKLDGKWSVKDHIGHLIDLEELHEGRLLDFKAKKDVLRAADMSNKKTNKAAHNEVPTWKLVNAFEKTRHHFLKTLEKLSIDELEQVAHHPRLNKPMRVVDMIYFVAEHDDHHLTIIHELIGKFGKK